MMTNRERYQTTLRRLAPDRIPIWEWCFWPETIARWQKEGFPANTEPQDFLGMDRIVQVALDNSLRLPAQKLEETEQYSVSRNEDGVTIKSLKGSYAPPMEIDFAIKGAEDWSHHKDRLVFDEARISRAAHATVRQARSDAIFSICSPVEPAWWILRTLRPENALMAMVTDPEWIADMAARQTDLIIKMLKDLVQADALPDAVWFWADLCYKNGMLFSPAVYRELFLPHHQRIAQFCHAHNRLLILHCDGDVRAFIPLLIEAGFDCIQPLEARAGNDVRQLKKEYGNNISLFGNINMDVLARGVAQEIEEEVISKVMVAKQGGGYVYHSDHSVPPAVSFDVYRMAVELARKHGSY